MWICLPCLIPFVQEKLLHISLLKAKLKAVDSELLQLEKETLKAALQRCKAKLNAITKILQQ
jgi:hypothetical protein